MSSASPRRRGPPPELRQKEEGKSQAGLRDSERRRGALDLAVLAAIPAAYVEIDAEK